MAQFPQVQANSLAGKRYKLPGDFSGALNLLFIAFEMHHQIAVNTWIPAAEALTARYPALRAYELPTISDRPRLQRWFIDSGMRAGIPDRRTHEMTITLYLDKRAFRRALAIPHERAIHTLLVDRDGNVLWRATGPFTPAAGAALEARLAELLPVAA